MLLRKHAVPTDPDSGRYQWKSLTSPQVVKIGKLIKAGEHKKAQREGLDKLKASKSKKTTSNAKTGTAKKKTSRKSA